MSSVDLAIEMIDMDKFYDTDADFKRFVDASMKTYGKPLASTYDNQIVREYYRSLQKGGCNAKIK